MLVETDGTSAVCKMYIGSWWVKVQMVDCSTQSAHIRKKCIFQASSSSWQWQQTWW